MGEELKPCPYCGEIPKRPRDFFGTDGENLWGVCCENVNCHVDIGVWHEDKSEAIRMWNSIPRSLRWTKEVPTKPGYYWNRNPDELRGCVVEVFEWGGKFYAFYPGNEVEEEISPDDEWAGPLEMPLDDKRRTK